MGKARTNALKLQSRGAGGTEEGEGLRGLAPWKRTGLESEYKVGGPAAGIPGRAQAEAGVAGPLALA